MLSGLKFIPKDQVEREHDQAVDASLKEGKKSGRKKDKDRRRKKSSHFSSSDDDLEKIKKGSRKKKKWYASDEDLSSETDESESGSESDYEKRRRRRKGKKEKRRRHENSSEGEGREFSKKKVTSRKERFDSDDSVSDDSSGEDSHHKGGKRRRHKKKVGEGRNKDFENEFQDNNGAQGSESLTRKEIGLEFMLRPKETAEKVPVSLPDDQTEKAPSDEVNKYNPRELNPYLKDNGSGYPEESEGTRTGGSQLMSSVLVGDGGASWRLKALRRAQEQAAREGRELKEVVEERFGSMSQLAVSVATQKAAPDRAHLHAIKSRRKGLGEEEQTTPGNDNEKVDSLRHPRMKVPKHHDSLSWGKRKQNVPNEGSRLVSAAISGLNKFKNDGTFLSGVMQQKDDGPNNHAVSSYSRADRREDSGLTPQEDKEISQHLPVPSLSSNQLAAKVLQLRMKGKHEEAEKLLKEAENLKVKQSAGDEFHGRRQSDASSSRYVTHGTTLKQRRKEEDTDLHLAQRIMRNHQYSISGQADDEYDYDEGPRKKSRKKGGASDRKPTERRNLGKHFLTQQERCQFCFENPNRPKHLVIAIANSAYLSLPHKEPIVPGHCCILTTQHESATRSVDDNVWNEIRNFKKCLIMVFGQQDKDVVFLETVMGLARQQRHCLVECIPLPRDIAKQAPVYFKKAIDEAEDEWSQHNAKKLIDTSQKGLRGSIPKNFPYFYVEFGLDKGFVHVIDDEKEFKSSFGLNVVRGMLRLPAEDMHRHRKYESVEKQKEAALNFARDWEPFDWTKQLDS